MAGEQALGPNLWMGPGIILATSFKWSSKVSEWFEASRFQDTPDANEQWIQLNAD